MEFTKALKEAVEIGLSKDEFTYVWDREMDLKILNHNVLCYEYETKVKEGKDTEVPVQEIQNLKAAYQELKFELVNMKNELISQNQEMVTKISQFVKQQQNQDLVLILESVKTLKEESEMLKTYVSTQFNDLTRKFDNFSSDINYELPNVKQKLLEAHCQNNTSFLPGASNMNSTGSHIANDDVLSKNSQGSKHLESPATINEQDKESISTSISSQEDLQIKNIKKTNHFSKSYQNKSFGNFNKVKKKKTCTVVAVPLDQPKTNPADLHAPLIHSQNGTQEAVVDSNKVNKTQSCTVVAVPLGQPKTKPADQTVVPCHKSTPETADIDQNNSYSSCQTSASLTSNDSNSTELNHETDKAKDELHEDIAGGKMEKTNSALAIISVPYSTTVDKLADYGVKFTIPETHGFYRYKEDFYTQYFPLKNTPCKVRMRLRLKEDDKIQVSALVSSIKSSEVVVPISFEGNGFISAKFSGGRGYTQIWRIEYKLYRKPQLDQDFCIDAHVCLKTKRKQHNNVTYKKLVDLGYDQQKRLQFFWDFRAY
ncbi:hypothetical protein Btru_000348 [Bulinus truncatus]|nr:hypothetical protein Btru_000348 [Bulinus truncatus]